MGTDSRHAKDAAIKLALVKLKSYMPGLSLIFIINITNLNMNVIFY